MKKYTTILLLLLILVLTSCTPHEFVKTTLSEEIGDNIIWKVIQTPDLNGAPASINVLDIDMNKFSGNIVLAWYKGELKTVTDIAIEHDGIAAINGSFFDLNKTGGSVLFLQENGKVIQTTYDSIAFINEGAYALDTAGVVHIVKRDGDWEYSPAYTDMIVSGPLMIYNNELEDLDSVRFNLTRHPRTAIGITNKNHFIMVAVDGRQEEAAGMSMWELQSFMDKLDCKDALNFDGGGSTMMYIKGKGIVNYPSDNKKFDHEGERKVANGLVVTSN